MTPEVKADIAKADLILSEWIRVEFWRRMKREYIECEWDAKELGKWFI